MGVIYYFRKDIAMKCKYCEKEFTPQRATGQYCSDACRKLWNKKVSVAAKTSQKLVSVAEEPLASRVSVANVDAKSLSVAKLSRDQLYAKIHGYPANTWKDSLEYAELIHRLKAMPLSELEAQGYQIPNWKEHGLPCPIVFHNAS